LAYATPKTYPLYVYYRVFSRREFFLSPEEACTDELMGELQRSRFERMGGTAAETGEVVALLAERKHALREDV